MASPDTKYNVEIMFRVTDESGSQSSEFLTMGTPEAPMKWSGVNYATVVGFENLMVQSIRETVRWGMVVADAIGQKSQLDRILANPNVK